MFMIPGSFGINSLSDDGDFAVIISSVSSLQNEPEFLSVDPILLNGETNSVGSENFVDVEGDLSAPEVEAEFEQVYVSSPLGQYENEGSRESPACQEASKSQKQPGEINIDKVSQERFLEDGQPLKLVSVDKIIQGQKKAGRSSFRSSLSNFYLNKINYNFEGKGFKGFDCEESTKQRRKRGRPKGKPGCSVKKVTTHLSELKKPTSDGGESKSVEQTFQEIVSEAKNEAKDVEQKMEEDCNRIRRRRKIVRPSRLILPDERQHKRKRRQQMRQKKFEEQTSEAITSNIAIHSKINVTPFEGEIELNRSMNVHPSELAIESNYKNSILQKKRRHSQLQPGVTPSFKCEQCGNRYFYLRGLRQHMKLECNVPPQFPCPFCPRRYRYRQCIRDHVKMAHPLAFPKWYNLHYGLPTSSRRKISEVNSGATQSQ